MNNGGCRIDQIFCAAASFERSSEAMRSFFHVFPDESVIGKSHEEKEAER